MVNCVHTVTPRAKAMFDKQVWGAAACTVRKSTQSFCFLDDAVISVEESGKDRTSANVAGIQQHENNKIRTFTVDLDIGTCTRCPD
ncbi:hypothetical protein JG688_00013265 [Phytophthora aleatoria]|uniref:Uncharacterized protein n=1 Tax=Phytophthora aleatoria TaxID=2496075 RepID=A0A8J5ME18_9STRA|nr:hypothetical protein JG688_00013265 [Phytophthora aleatoria]